ncbi:MAG: hypothetical protein JW855_01490 [Gammaproteobacteria bacterium]|nr:hypothetical protein [Gammaproteobacteria bacterium]
MEYSKDLTSSKEKGARLITLRKMAFLTRKAFCDKYHYNYETVRSWENGSYGGLPARRAKEIVNAFRSSGLIVNFEWLMYGLGEEPKPIDLSLLQEAVILYLKELPESKEPVDVSEEARMGRELEFFCLGQPDAVSIVIEDDGMSPAYQVGDLVAGIKRYEKSIQKLIGQDCIVHSFDDDKPLLRQIHPGKEKGTYTLVCTNLDTEVKAPVLNNVRLISAAPAVWRRKKDLIEENHSNPK